MITSLYFLSISHRAAHMFVSSFNPPSATDDAPLKLVSELLIMFMHVSFQLTL